MKRSVRRPTEDIAIARVMAQKGPTGNPTLLHKVIMDETGAMYQVWCFHSTINTSISYLWSQWQKHRDGGQFVDFLQSCGIIYKYRKAS